MKKIFVLIIGFSLTIFFFLRECYAFDNGDFQYWCSGKVSAELSTNWKCDLEEELRFGDNARDFYFRHTDLGFTYSGIASWLDIGIHYRHINVEEREKWKTEKRPHLNAILKGKLFDVSLNNRGRFEYRNREDSENYWRYRNKFTVKFPFKFTKYHIQPYIADEIFYDFNQNSLNGNRFYSGINIELVKHLKAEVYYLWLIGKKDDKWIDLHVFGTKLKISF